MNYSFLIPFLVIGSCFTCVERSQAQTRRAVNETQLQPEAQAEIALEGDDYVYGAVNLLHSTGNNASNKFEQAQLHFGYEHFWNDRWSWGATLRGVSYGSGSNGLDGAVLPELLIRHWNALGGFNFRQRLGLRYLVPFQSGSSRAQTALRFDLDRLVPLGEHVALRPRLAYEGVVYLRLQRDLDVPKERFIDFSNWRAELGVRLSDHVDFTPWFGHQTTYAFALPQTDGTGKVVVPGGRLNLVTPVVGLDARFTIFSGALNAERRQLPTQH
ncbi:hypothetical protein [Hymenobacter sp. BT491]|uniref:hypothetical protein n=1 Tax=Hymenobacter sp. BT491 TaxID=2766779 RepID=UPI0016539678|nr:hypothetical protein [Hymenobacter sp. BT491]MBC6990827.1 hypothetical protein [Hymenobacter sp. BT491]